MLTGRNLAKYMHAAERFALGQATTQDSYLTAANQRDDADIFYDSYLTAANQRDDADIFYDVDLSSMGMWPHVLCAVF